MDLRPLPSSQRLSASRSMGRVGPSQPKSLPCGVFSSLSISHIPITWTFYLHQATLWGGDQAWAQMATGPKHLSTQVGIKTHKDICSACNTLASVCTHEDTCSTFAHVNTH